MRIFRDGKMVDAEVIPHGSVTILQMKDLILECWTHKFGIDVRGEALLPADLACDLGKLIEHYHNAFDWKYGTSTIVSDGRIVHYRIPSDES